MSVTWDDTISDGDKGFHTWANDIITAIKSRGAKYVVRSDAYGDYRTDGTDDDVQIQQALDALTGGRTSKEKVLCIGDFTIGSTITLDSYTILEVLGSLTLANSANANMVSATSKNHVDILGGYWDGNRANQTSGVVGILFSGVTKSRIANIYGYDHYSAEINIDTASANNIVENCHLEGANYCINVDNGDKNVIANNEIIDAIYTGIRMTNGSHHNTVVGNRVEGCDSAKAVGGVGIDAGSDADFTTITGNNVNNNNIGIRVNTGSVSCVVSGNVCEANGHGIRFDTNCHYGVISGNVCQDGTVGTADHGIYVSDSNEVVIVGNNASRNYCHGILLNTCNDCTIEGNIVIGNDRANQALYDGIQLVACDNCLITGNRVGDNDRYEINISDNACDNTRLINNILAGSDRSAVVVDVGTRTVPTILATAVSSLDLSGGATDLEIFLSSIERYLIGYSLAYTEASSADAGVNVRVGRYQDGVALDDDYFDLVTSEVSQNKGYTKNYKTADLTNQVISADDVVTVGTAGGKAGTGEVLVRLKIV